MIVFRYLICLWYWLNSQIVISKKNATFLCSINHLHAPSLTHVFIVYIHSTCDIKIIYWTKLEKIPKREKKIIWHDSFETIWYRCIIRNFILYMVYHLFYLHRQCRISIPVWLKDQTSWTNLEVHVRCPKSPTFTFFFRVFQYRCILPENESDIPPQYLNNREKI